MKSSQSRDAEASIDRVATCNSFSVEMSANEVEANTWSPVENALSATNRRTSFDPDIEIEASKWSPEERDLFYRQYRVYAKDLEGLAKSIPTKSVKEVVFFYYYCNRTKLPTPMRNCRLVKKVEMTSKKMSEQQDISNGEDGMGNRETCHRQDECKFGCICTSVDGSKPEETHCRHVGCMLEVDCKLKRRSSARSKPPPKLSKTSTMKARSSRIISQPSVGNSSYKVVSGSEKFDHLVKTGCIKIEKIENAKLLEERKGFHPKVELNRNSVYHITKTEIQPMMPTSKPIVPKVQTSLPELKTFVPVLQKKPVPYLAMSKCLKLASTSKPSSQEVDSKTSKALPKMLQKQIQPTKVEIPEFKISKTVQFGPIGDGKLAKSEMIPTPKPVTNDGQKPIVKTQQNSAKPDGAKAVTTLFEIDTSVPDQKLPPGNFTFKFQKSRINLPPILSTQFWLFAKKTPGAAFTKVIIGSNGAVGIPNDWLKYLYQTGVPKHTSILTDFYYGDDSLKVLVTPVMESHFFIGPFQVQNSNMISKG